MSYKDDITYSPYGFIARLKDMIDQLNIQLDSCDNDGFKIQFRMIKHGLESVVQYYDNITFDPKEELK